MMRMLSHGHIEVSGRPNEVNRTATFTPNSTSIVARGATDAAALAALASEMRRIADEIDARILTAERR